MSAYHYNIETVFLDDKTKLAYLYLKEQRIKTEMEEKFTCPLSLEIFHDPYVDDCIPVPHKFERNMIIQEIQARQKCPFSKKPLNINSIQRDIETLLEKNVMQQKLEKTKGKIQKIFSKKGLFFKDRYHDISEPNFHIADIKIKKQLLQLNLSSIHIPYNKLPLSSFDSSIELIRQIQYKQATIQNSWTVKYGYNSSNFINFCQKTIFQIYQAIKKNLHLSENQHERLMNVINNYDQATIRVEFISKQGGNEIYQLSLGIIKDQKKQVENNQQKIVYNFKKGKKKQNQKKKGFFKRVFGFLCCSPNQDQQIQNDIMPRNKLNLPAQLLKQVPQEIQNFSSCKNWTKKFIGREGPYNLQVKKMFHNSLEEEQFDINDISQDKVAQEFVYLTQLIQKQLLICDEPKICHYLMLKLQIANKIFEKNKKFLSKFMKELLKLKPQYFCKALVIFNDYIKGSIQSLETSIE